MNDLRTIASIFFGHPSSQRLRDVASSAAKSDVVPRDVTSRPSDVENNVNASSQENREDAFVRVDGREVKMRRVRVAMATTEETDSEPSSQETQPSVPDTQSQRSQDSAPVRRSRRSTKPSRKAVEFRETLALYKGYDSVAAEMAAEARRGIGQKREKSEVRIVDDDKENLNLNVMKGEDVERRVRADLHVLRRLTAHVTSLRHHVQRIGGQDAAERCDWLLQYMTDFKVRDARQRVETVEHF